MMKERSPNTDIIFTMQVSPELQNNLKKMQNILDNDYSKFPDTVQNTLKAW